MSATLRKPFGHQTGLLITLAVLAAYYVVVFRPLAERERAQTAPFEAMQARLRTAGTNNPAVSGLSDEALVRTEEALLRSLTNVARARELIVARHAPEPDIAGQLTSPFQLIDYQNERLNRGDRLIDLAAKGKVRLTPAVTAGLPEFTIENPTPELLWGQLSLVDGVLRAAVAAGVASIERVSMTAPITHLSQDSSAHKLIELPMRLEVVGGFDAVTRFLGITLLDPKERETLKLPVIDGLPGVTLQHILVRKESATPPGTVRLLVEFRGFLRLTTDAPR